MSAEQPKKHIFFLDRTHGKSMRTWLKAVGLSLEYHDHYFLPEDLDTLWIARCAKEGWVILSGDKRVETVPENRQAAINGKCKVFFFADTNSKTEEWAAAVLVGRKRIIEIIERNNGPFFVTIEKFARSHISKIRYCAEGGPKPAEAVPPPEPSAPVKPKHVRKNQQRNLFEKDG